MALVAAIPGEIMVEPLSLDLRVICPVTWFSYESKKSYRFSVCSNFSFCKEECYLCYVSLYITEIKTEVPYSFL